MKAVKFFLPNIFASIIITIVFTTMYVVVQQVYRSGANDPQVQVAKDIVDRLTKNSSLTGLIPAETIDITRSLSPFYVLFNGDGNPVESSGRLHGSLPRLPVGVLKFTQEHLEHRLTWQPDKHERFAMVMMKVNNSQIATVAVGRNLREVEIRINRFVQMIFAGWVLSMLTVFAYSIFNFYRKKNNY